MVSSPWQDKEVALLNENKVILAVGAHPDDIEFLMAGTLALLKKKGFRIYLSSIGSGNMGSMELRADEIGRKRYNEAKASAKLLEADYYSLGESCLHIVFDNPTRFKVTELLRKINPFVVLTQSPQDYTKDHELTADLVWDACFNASIPNYITHQANPAPPTKKIPYLYYADAIEGVDRFGNPISPDFYVDITAVIKIKEKMLACHESQRSWLKAQHGMDQYLESMRQWSRKRGSEVGVKYAEPFRQHKGHPFPQDNILQKLIGVIMRDI